MKYFEFNNHEYWAMVAAEDEERAIEVYVEEVAGESIEEIKEKGEPTEITREQALNRYIEASISVAGYLTIEEITEEFNERKNTTLLIDSSLT
ncbi:hypothetical protein [Bacillus mycoides]|uniref:hypothetical protein n=1 Tax=Bacillus mycoides TaxID=1405 RepID=UPI002E1DFE94|nr:hypothetical protein [Bacillus mycoides]MED1054337.1 hypothetical protein [Bacillus mycoides]